MPRAGEDRAINRRNKFAAAPRRPDRSRNVSILHGSEQRVTGCGNLRPRGISREDRIGSDPLPVVLPRVDIFIDAASRDDLIAADTNNETLITPGRLRNRDQSRRRRSSPESGLKLNPPDDRQARRP